MESADLILLLISPDFIASDYCWDIELARAMERHEIGLSQVVPIFVRPVDWRGAPFASLQGLPKDALAVTEWSNEDAAWRDVEQGLRTIIEEVKDRKKRVISPVEAKPIQDLLREDIERLDRQYNRENYGGPNGIPTGFIDIDRMTDGLKPGQLCVIASRPEMGKTSLSLNMVATAANANLPVLIFSTKNSAADIAQRLLTATGKINSFHYSRGMMKDEDWPRLTDAIQKISEWTLEIDDKPSLSIEYVRQQCSEFKKKWGALPLVLIDSITYLSDWKSSGENNVGIGQSLKMIARVFNTAVLVTAQLSRDLEFRVNKRPIRGDMKDHGDLVDEADILMFIYIDSRYNYENLEPRATEIIIAKNQFGSLGTVLLNQQFEYGMFKEYMNQLENKKDLH